MAEAALRGAYLSPPRANPKSTSRACQRHALHPPPLALALANRAGLRSICGRRRASTTRTAATSRSRSRGRSRTSTTTSSGPSASSASGPTARRPPSSLRSAPRALRAPRPHAAAGDLSPSLSLPARPQAASATRAASRSASRSSSSSACSSAGRRRCSTPSRSTRCAFRSLTLLQPGPTPARRRRA